MVFYRHSTQVDPGPIFSVISEGVVLNQWGLNPPDTPEIEHSGVNTL